MLANLRTGLGGRGEGGRGWKSVPMQGFVGSLLVLVINWFLYH